MSTALSLVVLDEAGEQVRAPETGEETIRALLSLTDPTGNEIAHDLQVIVNKATSGDVTIYNINVTDTASPGALFLQEWGVGGTPHTSIDGVGQLRLDKTQTFGATTGIAFGGGGIVIHGAAETELQIRVSGGVKAIVDSSSVIRGSGADTPSLRAASATATNPTVLARRGDLDSGQGAAAEDQPNMIAGGVEAVRWSETSDHVIVTHELHAGLTADVGSVQGGLPLLSSRNEIATCANVGDSATLTAAAAGIEQTIINNGANACDVFPASGDNLGAGVDTAASLAAGATITYLAYDATNWKSI